MCGRYSLVSRGKEIAEAFGLDDEPALEARYNVGPGQQVPVVRATENGRELPLLQWGFHRSGTGGGMLINARSETAAARPAFRDSVERRRCLVPATGFFEWRRQGTARAPFHLVVRDRPVFAMAGIWSWWPDERGKNVESMVILTTRPNELVSQIHDRMPVILAPELEARWIDPAPLREDTLAELTRPLPAELMTKIPVSTRVNSVAHDDPEVLAPVEEPPEQLGLF